MAPVMFAAAKLPEVRAHLISTGQHRHLLDTALHDFGLTPEHDLNVMKANQDLGELTTRILGGLAPVFHALAPDAVLVQGDTTTAFCGALAAFYQHIPVYHVEAGLRSHRLDAPFPEEANRSLIGRLARLHFAPTQSASLNLLREGVAPDHIHVTGNTVIDALLWMRARLPAQFPDPQGLLGDAARALASGVPFILVTAHRRENFGDGIAHLCHALAEIAGRYPQFHLVFPVHLNPNIQVPVRELLGHLPNVHLLPPLEYAQFVWLMDRCRFLITDSGGVQEEAATLGKPLIVTRAVTERTEAVSAHSAMLTGTDTTAIVSLATRLIEQETFYASMAQAASVYGDGQAATRIAHAVAADVTLLPKRSEAS